MVFSTLIMMWSFFYTIQLAQNGQTEYYRVEKKTWQRQEKHFRKKVNFVRYSKASSRKQWTSMKVEMIVSKNVYSSMEKKLLIILIKHCFKNLTTTSLKTEVYCISKQRWEFWPEKQKVVIHVHIADMQKTTTTMKPQVTV